MIRIAVSLGLDRLRIEAVERNVAGKFNVQFLELLDDWLTDRESKARNIDPATKVKLGVAMYMFVRPADAVADEPAES